MFFDIGKISDDYKKIKIINLIPIFSILMFSQFLRSNIQRFLLNELGIRLTVKQNFILFLAGLSMIITPGGTGQLIKSHFIKQKFGYPITQSLPLVFAERFCDLLAVSLTVIVTLFFFYSVKALFIIVISFGLAGFILAFIKNKEIRVKLICYMGKIKFFNKLLPLNNEIQNSMDNIFKTRIIFIAASLAFIAFFIEGFVVYLGLLTFNIDLGYLQSIQMYYTSLIAGTLSFIPGGVGVTEGGYTILLQQKNMELSLAVSIVIFTRLTTIWFSTIVGFIAAYIVKLNKS